MESNDVAECESRKRKASDDVLESSKRAASNETGNVQLEASKDTENVQLEASSDEDIQPCTVETVQSQNWSDQPKTICGFIWSADDDEMSRGAKLIGIQLTSSSGGGRDCKFLVDAKLRASDVIWEVMPFEMKKESERLQLFKRSSVAVKRKYVDLFPKTTTLQTDVLSVGESLYSTVSDDTNYKIKLALHNDLDKVHEIA